MGALSSMTGSVHFPLVNQNCMVYKAVVGNRVMSSSTFGDPSEAARIRAANEKCQAKQDAREAKKKPKLKHWSQVLRYLTLEPEAAKRKRQIRKRPKPGPASRHKSAKRGHPPRAIPNFADANPGTKGSLG